MIMLPRPNRNARCSSVLGTDSEVEEDELRTTKPAKPFLRLPPVDFFALFFFGAFLATLTPGGGGGEWRIS